MITREQAAIAKGLLARGDKQSDIAAFLSTNSGRIAEINTGARHKDVAAVPGKDLPTVSEVAGGFVIFLANQALDRAALGIRAAKSYLNDYEAAREARERTEKLRSKVRKGANRGKRIKSSSNDDRPTP